MLCTDIVEHLMRYLPRVSDSFSEYITPTSIVVLGSTVTITAANHGIKDEQPFSVTHSEVKNLISAFETVSSGVRLTTTNPHDLTSGWKDSETIKLKSATDETIDGTYDIVSIGSGSTFTIASFADTGLTDVYAYEPIDYGIDGLYNAAVIDKDSFSFELDFGEEIADDFTLNVDTESTRIHNKLRITGTNEIDRWLQTYEKTCDGEQWAVAELGGFAVSKGGNTQTDATEEQPGFAMWRVNQIQPLGLNIVVPCFETTGRKARDTVEAERANIYKSILGAKFDTGLSNEGASAITPEDDGESKYNTAYYVHELRFSQLARITNDDRLFVQRTTPFRAIQIDFYHEDTDNDNVIMELSAELDN